MDGARSGNGERASARRGEPGKGERLADWADGRLGIYALAKANMRKVFPDHWSFMLGEIALYSFIVLLLTGTFLALFFDPSMDEVRYNGVYTPLKRVSAFAAIPGGVVGSLPPVIGWAAGGGSVTDARILAVAFFFFVWQVPHFWSRIVFTLQGMPLLGAVVVPPGDPPGFPPGLPASSQLKMQRPGPSSSQPTSSDPRHKAAANAYCVPFASPSITTDWISPELPSAMSIRSTSSNPAGSGADTFVGRTSSSWKTM